MSRLVLFLLVLIGVIQLDCALDPRQDKEKQLLNQILTDSYDKHIRPSSPGGGPTVTTINFYVRSIDSIDDHKMEYSCQLTFRAEWQDDRLIYDERNASGLNFLTLPDTSRIWMPDIFFANEKEGKLHSLLLPNSYVRIFPNGTILYSSRLSLKLSCPMDLRRYPFDTQSCLLRLASYGHIDSQVKFLWKEKDPVQIGKTANPGKFIMDDVTTETCDSTTSTGTYSCLRANFNFRRIYGYYGIQMYTPTSMMIIIGWLSFWLDPKSTGRVITCLVTLLVMAMMISFANFFVIPATNYTKAIDVWTGVSLTFVFVSLVIYIVVNYLSRCTEEEQTKNSKSAKEPKESNKHDLEVGSATGNKGKTATLKRTNEMATKYCGGLSTKAQKIDVASRILYPLAFFAFNILYWACYKW